MDRTIEATGSAPQDRNSGHAAFGWPEVSCFLRPQALLCEEAYPGYGRLLLGLTSLYRTWGAEGFFVHPNLGHLAFLTSRFEEITGLGFLVSYLEDRYRIAEILRDHLLPKAGTAIVPTNIRELPQFKGFMREDSAHFFLIQRFDEKSLSFQALDYLHVRDDNQSLEYSPCMLPIGLFSLMAKHYWDRFVGLHPHLHGDSRYWVLQARADKYLEPRSERELCSLMLQSCREVLVLMDDAPDSVHPLDDRFLSALRLAHDSGDAKEFARAAYLYFAAANHSRVYLKVVCHSLTRLGYPAHATRVASQLESWEHDASHLRMKLLVKCKLFPTLDSAIWAGFSAQLGSLSENLRHVALSEIRGLVES